MDISLPIKMSGFGLLLTTTSDNTSYHTKNKCAAGSVILHGVSKVSYLSPILQIRILRSERLKTCQDTFGLAQT